MITLINAIKQYFRSIVLLPGLLIFLFFSCKVSKDEDCTQWDYDNCNTEWPYTGEVEVKLTINNEYRLQKVRLYEGDFEKGKLVWERAYGREVVNELLETEVYYSFTATYLKNNGDTIIAVDGGTLGVRSYRACELTCYELKRLTIDLRVR